MMRVRLRRLFERHHETPRMEYRPPAADPDVTIAYVPGQGWTMVWSDRRAA